MTIEHKTLEEAERHGIAAWEVISIAARDALSVTYADVGKVCHVLGRGCYFLAAVGPATWERISEEYLLANAGARYKVLAFAVKKTSALGSWALLGESDGGRVAVGVSSVGVSGSDLSITYGYTGSGGYITAQTDDAFAALGLQCGISVGNTNCIVKLFAPLTGPIYNDGIRTNTALGQDVVQVVAATAGTIAITHKAVTHAENEGTAVLAQAVDGARWQVTGQSKTGFTLNYQKRAAAAVGTTGSAPSITSDLAYPAAISPAVTNQGGFVRFTGLHGMPAAGTGNTYVTCTGFGGFADGTYACTVTSATVIDTTIPYAASGAGTILFAPAVWVTDHMVVQHPAVTDSATAVALTQQKAATAYVLQVGARTVSSFEVWFKDMAGAAVSAYASTMIFDFTRNGWCNAQIPATYVGSVFRSNVGCDAVDIYNASGSIFFSGLLEID